jgi:uncharacterized cofD-like protein
MKVTVIGGGTGTTAVLQGLKEYQDLQISVIVTMMDDGGSNAVVRDDFGLLPLSDLRKSIIALSKHSDDQIFRKLFTYRFSKGNGLSGHTLGNLIMVGLSEITGSELKTIDAMSAIFDVRGKILPVTLDSVRLVAEYEDGSQIVGEHFIDQDGPDKRIVKLSLNSKAKAYGGAIDAILNSEFVVIGPGDLYTSLISNLIVPGISESLRKTKAQLIYVPNLMSKKGETRGMHVSHLLAEIERYVGRRMDYVLVNSSKPAAKILKRYKEDGEAMIADDLGKKEDGRVVAREDILSTNAVEKEKGDTLKRSFIRHDPQKLATELYNIFRKWDLGMLGRLVREITGPAL